MQTRTTKADVLSLGFAAALIVVTACVAPALAAGPDEGALARKVLAETGLRGGMIVHLGCGDGKLTGALAGEGSYLVHGLETDPVKVAAARAHIRSLGAYGKVSVERLRGGRLPYIDNLVNLLVTEDLAGVAMAEVMRVLAPGGMAYVKTDGKWTKTVKPRPDQIDEWTHYLHDASNNAVGHDTRVGPPRRLQWVGGPRWARHHDHMASMSALVSAGGRIFYIFDEGPTASIQLAPKWRLIARDAFNGTLLWKRVIPTWQTHLWPLKSGPAQLPRRLVAEGDRVYVTLALDAPLTALDAATGKTVRTYEDTQAAMEVIASDGVLFVLADKSSKKPEPYRAKGSYCWDETKRANRSWAWDQQPRRVMAVRADGGEVLWRKDYPVAPVTLAADAKGVYFHDGTKVVCLDRATGEQLWASEAVARRRPLVTSFAPTLVLHDGVVVFSGGNRFMTALSAETGKVLWSAKHPRSGHMSPEDLLVIDGLVWAGEIAVRRNSGVFTGRDLRTGEVKVEFPPDVEPYWFHHRCYRSKATVRYLMPSRTGIELVDFRTKHWTINHWVRGGCIYGVMPCNGLIYAPPHSCACYMESKLYGFNALAAAPPAGTEPKPSSDDNRLERGPAYGQAAGPGDTAGAGDWPTYRHDGARSGFTPSPVPAKLKPAWQVELGGKLSSVVVAEGKAFVASPDAHQVHALDAATGRVLWRFTAGGRIDSPPTIWRGRAIFGAADGWVYCLRGSDGALVWRFRAAPADRRMTAFGQVESPWPVHGSVLVRQEQAPSGSAVVYCVAGRSMFLDGGMRLCRLDAATGRKLSETVLDDRDPATGEDLQMKMNRMSMPVALSDVLSSDGRSVYMRSQRFGLDGKRQEIAPGDVTKQAGEGVHLFSPVGFLDGSWLHRSYWMYGRRTDSGWGGWFRAGRYVPSGRIMVMDDSRIYGFARKPEYMCQSAVLEYHLFAAAKVVDDEAIRAVIQADKRMNAAFNKGLPKKQRKSVAVADWRVRRRSPASALAAANFKWSQGDLPLQARAMVLAGKTLFIAGPPDVADEVAAFEKPDDPAVRAKLAAQAEALAGLKGAWLWAVAAADGAKLAEYKLDSPPVWDGMAAANGKLYLVTMDGKVTCLAGP